LIGRTLGGQYEITGRLGAGGMASVYRARQRAMGRDVALKVLERSPGLPAELVARFERERDVVSRLHHPHILPVFDFGQDDNHLYIAMQLVEGGSLDQHGALAPELAAQLIEQLCSALEYAHGQGVIHRDLKPSNLLLEGGRHVYLMDFGIALLAQATNLTTTGSVVGTPAYLSPEQLTGAPPSPRSDVYSAGVLAFELFTGKKPFDGELYAVIQKHLNEAPPSVRALQPELPADLDAVLARALAKDPEKRLKTAGEFGAAVAAAVAGRSAEVDRLLGRTSSDDTIPGLPIQEPVPREAAQEPPPPPPRPKRRLAPVVALLLALGVAGASTRLAGGHLAHPLAYAVIGNDSAEIRLRKPDGSGAVLANGASTPHFSPTGRLMTFDRNGDVWLLEGGQQRNLTNHAALDFWGVFRPDGKSVLFHSNRDGGNFHLFELELASGRVTQLTSGPGNDQWPAVSPDGQLVAFSSDRHGSPGLWLIGPGPGQPRPLLQEGARFPVWSPDGKRLAFQSSSRGTTALYVTELANPNGVKPVVQTPGEQEWPAWAPAEELAFSSGGNIFACSPDGSGLRQLTQLGGHASASYPAWSY